MSAGMKNSPSLVAEAIAAQKSPELVQTTPAAPLRACANCNAAYALADDSDGMEAEEETKLECAVDILRLPSKWSLPRLRAPSAWLADLRYTLERLTHTHAYPDVATEVLGSERVRAGLEKSLDETGLTGSAREAAEAELRKKAKGYLGDMAASLSSFVLRTVAYILLKVFRCFLSGILVSRDQMERLSRLAAEAEASKTPIIYLPLHRSHLDYILLTYILWHHDLRCPHVASGDNLNFACFGWLLRGLGAFFIRRRLDKGVAEGKRDFVYRAVLHSYMESLLREGQPIEFFMEGTRSRLGKSLQPKAGLLSIIVEALDEGVIQDALLVPVSYSYEKVLDQGFVEELLGREKKKESLWGVWASICGAFGCRYGAVKVDFGAATSLKALGASLAGRLAADEVEAITMPGNGVTTPAHSANSLLCSSSEPLQRASSSLQHSASAVGALNSEKRLLVHAIAHHCLSEATANAAVTGTQLIACLLASKYKEGASLQELLLDFAWLSGEARLRGVSLVGGLGDGAVLDEEANYAGCDEERALEAVREALNLLGGDIIYTEAWDDRLSSGGASDWPETDSGIFSMGAEGALGAGNLFVRVRASPLAACLMAYYKAGAMHVFALDGLLATAFLASECGGVADYGLVLERACELGRALGNQFLFAKPCQSLARVLEERLALRFANPRARVLQRRQGSLEPEDRPRLHSLDKREERPSQQWLPPEAEPKGDWDAFASSAPLRASPPTEPCPNSEGILPPIWEEADGEEEELLAQSSSDDCLWVSDLDEFYACRVLRFYQGLMPPYIELIPSHLRPLWL